MKYDCDVIRDLIPMYRDKVVSKTTSTIIDEHLSICEDCRRFYQDTDKELMLTNEAEPKSINSYAPIAKRIRKSKRNKTITVSVTIFMLIFINLFTWYAQGYRLNPMNAALASNSINRQTKLLSTMNIGDNWVHYIFDVNGEYKDIDVMRNQRVLDPFWKQREINGSYYTSQQDTNVGIQLIANKYFVNFYDDTSYYVYTFRVNDANVSFIEFGLENIIQTQNVESNLATFYFDGSDWNDIYGSDIIKAPELKGTAFAEDGTLLYKLTFLEEFEGAKSFKWISVD